MPTVTPRALSTLLLLLCACGSGSTTTPGASTTAAAGGSSPSSTAAGGAGAGGAAAGGSAAGGSAASGGAGGSGGAQASGGAGGAPGLIDGRILFRGLGEGVFFDVAMYAAGVAAPAPIPRGDGHCDVHAPGEGDGFVELFPPGDLDLGATVTATAGGTTLTAKVDTTSGGFAYEYAEAGVDAFGTTWTLACSGAADGLAATTLAEAAVPARVEPIVPPPGSGTLDLSGGTVKLEWTGGEGAETFHVNLATSKVEVDCYPPPGATSFTLPPEIVAKLDPSVSATLWAESVSIVKLGARRVLLRVTSDNLD
jgi:hypothetical protein